MIPDKVYLQEGLSVPVVGFVSPSWNNPKDKENTVEYIRKTALLNFIYQQIDSLNDKHLLDAAIHCKLNEIIEHINEM